MQYNLKHPGPPSHKNKEDKIDSLPQDPNLPDPRMNKAMISDPLQNETQQEEDSAIAAIIAQIENTSIPDPQDDLPPPSIGMTWVSRAN